MFDRCKLELSQGTTSIAITLYKASRGSYKEGFTFNGRFSAPSQNKHQEWELVPFRSELRLFDERGPGIGMSGGKSGELTPLEPIAILQLAYISTRGIEPINPSRIGNGTVKNGFSLAVGLNKGPVSWRMSAFLTGSHDWMEL
jgi:hypothetical protein